MTYDSQSDLYRSAIIGASLQADEEARSHIFHLSATLIGASIRMNAPPRHRHLAEHEFQIAVPCLCEKTAGAG